MANRKLDRINRRKRESMQFILGPTYVFEFPWLTEQEKATPITMTVVAVVPVHPVSLHDSSEDLR